MDAALVEASRCHSLDMAENNYFSHIGLNGSSPWDRFAEAGYTGGGVGENIASGQTSASGVVNGWMNSDGHCANIMSSFATETGLGFVPYLWTMGTGR